MLKSYLRYLLLSVLLSGAFFYAFQNSFIFQGDVVALDHQWNLAEVQPAVEFNIPFDSTMNINVVRFQPATDSLSGIVLYFHGNRRNIQRYARSSRAFTELGYECWVVDYPQYGKSTGELNVENLHEIALQLYRRANAQVASDSIVIYGKSLGTGIASFLASRRDARALLLETPYYSLSSLISEYAYMVPTPFIIENNLENGYYLSLTDEPVTIWHGTEDQLIPLQEPLLLTENFKAGDTLIIVPGAGHNGIPRSDVYKESLRRILERPYDNIL